MGSGDGEVGVNVGCDGRLLGWVDGCLEGFIVGCLVGCPEGRLTG